MVCVAAPLLCGGEAICAGHFMRLAGRPGCRNWRRDAVTWLCGPAAVATRPITRDDIDDNYLAAARILLPPPGV